jgi:hypothetical protein
MELDICRPLAANRLALEFFGKTAAFMDCESLEKLLQLPATGLQDQGFQGLG